VKVTAERVPESKVLLRIEVPPEQVEQAIEKPFATSVGGSRFQVSAG